MTTTDTQITIDDTLTLGGAFGARAALTPERTAYIRFDPNTASWDELTWRHVQQEVARWQKGLAMLGLEPGDRVAMMLRNCAEWVVFDQAAIGLGLVTVPIYTNDRAGNIAYILENAGVRVLLIEGQDQWQELRAVSGRLSVLDAVITLRPVDDPADGVNILHADAWVPAADASDYQCVRIDPDSLATIVYTSGTTGRPKGVKLSHRNILWNIRSVLSAISLRPEDRLLSFLPLSHTFERTTGYYLTIITGTPVAHARSVENLAEDLRDVAPTILIAVPRIFERVYARINAKLAQESVIRQRLFDLAVATGWQRFKHAQGRAGWSPWLLLAPLLDRIVASKVQARLGSRLRFAVAGGAALSPDIARFFIGLGIPIIQGYGLTETSPVITANRLEDNLPETVGAALPGIEIRVGTDAELLTRSPSVMLGYWNDEEATREVIDPEGWLHTGDRVALDTENRVTITGRLKEIICLANGEKVPPADMEMAIALDPVIEQVMVVGEGRPFLSALVVLSPEHVEKEAAAAGVDTTLSDALRDERLKQHILERIGDRLKAFPGYTQLRRVCFVGEPWTVENALMTPTMKLKRARILEHHSAEVEELYAGH